MLTMMVVLAAEGGGGLPQLNANDFAPQLVWLAITFTALYFIMARVALPRVGEVIEERSDRIQRDLDTAEKLKTETDEALTAYEKALADARANANTIAGETRDKLSSEVEQERHRVEDELAKKLSDAEASIAATKSKALESVSEIAGETASAIVDKLIGVNVSAADAQKALQQAQGK
ncbi:MAG: F0F1 ATP synthase subunit B [Hyphomicrobiaceae bacterium]